MLRAAFLTGTVLFRVDNYGAARKTIGTDRAFKRIHKDEIRVGNLCRCNTPLASRVQSEEGGTGAPWRCVGQDDEKRVGVTSTSSSVPSVISPPRALFVG